MINIKNYRLIIIASKNFFLFLLLTAFLVSYSSELFAQSAKKLRKRLPKKSLSIESSADDIYNFDLVSSFDDLLLDSTDSNLYDPITISSLQRLKDDARSVWNPEDIDPTKSRKIVEKALAIQSGVTISKLIAKSELKNSFKEVKRGLDSFQQFFRYSLQTDGESLTVSKKNHGKKLLELNVEINAKNGLDPQIHIGESFRFRYDYISKQTLLEYATNF